MFIPVYSEPIPDYWREIDSYDWDSDLAYLIMMCESSGNPDALNPVPPDYSIGLFQINLYGGNAKERPSEEWLRIGRNNIEYAYELYESGGFARHWRNCYNRITNAS